MKLKQICLNITPIVAFAFGIWYFCLRILGYNLEYIPGDLGDSRFINYLLEHCHQWMTGKASSFWDAGFMYPFKNAVALSDCLIGTAPLYSIWRLFNFTPETSYQLWWICICSLNYWVSFIVFKKWFNRIDIAVVLAWIFAFTFYNIGQLNYMQMIVRFMVPVAIYAVYKLIQFPSNKYFSIYSAALIFQLYSAMYTGIYLLYFSGLILFVYYILTKKWNELSYYISKEHKIKFFIICIISFIAIVNLFYPYIKIAKVVGNLHFNDIEANIPLWNSYLFPHQSSYTWHFMFEATMPRDYSWWLHYLYTGIIPLMSIIIPPFYLIYNKKKKIKTDVIIKTFILTSIIIIAFHLRTKHFITLYYFIFYLPGIRSLRVLIRFMNVELFLLLVLWGYFLVKVKSKYVYLLLLLSFCDNLFDATNMPKKEKKELIARKCQLINEIKKCDYKSKKALAYINSAQESYITNIDMMLASQQLGKSSINGYSSYAPAEICDFLSKNKNEGLNKWLDSEYLKCNEVFVLTIDKGK